MPAPGIITGRNLLAPEGYPNEVEGRFFSSFQGATPKSALNRGPRRSEFVETMARLIIDLPRGTLTSLLRSLPADTAAAAQTLLYGGGATASRTGNDTAAGYFDFLLTQATQQQAEREQVVDTLTDNTVIYYSGQSAPLLSCAGYFLNTYQDDQNVWFQLLYSDILRGSQLARRGLVARFRYDSFFFTGYLTNFGVTVTGDAKNYVQFSFNFRVKQVQIATPIVYNPTTAKSLLSENLFTDPSPAGADDVTRRGVEAAEQPATPRATPAASTQANVDAREASVTQGVPQREQQAVVDRAITTQAATATAVAVPGLAAPVISAGGDVRQQLPAEQAQLFQNFQTATPTPQQAPSDALAQLGIAIDARLRSADVRGTTVISPVNGVVTRSSAYADTIARAPTTAVATATTATSSPGPVAPLATDQAGQDLLDVYRPPSRLLAAFLAVRQGQPAPAPRSRQRSTP